MFSEMIDEWIDVLDERGALSGVRKRKPDIHRDGDWHRAVHVWIATPDGRVLLQKRSLAKENNPGLWDVSVAGHLSAGETAVDAAIREAAEEIGLNIAREELEHIGDTREACVLNGGRYLDNEFHEIYLVRRDVDLASLRLQPGEVDAVMLIDPRELRVRRHLVPHAEEYELLLAALH